MEWGERGRPVSGGFLQLKIEGPRGTVAKGQILANLRRIRSSWMPDTMRAAGQYVRQILLARQFQQEGSYLGSRWKSLSSSYLAWKRHNNYSEKIGVRTGALLAALTGSSTTPFTMDGPWHKTEERARTIDAKPILEYTADSVTIGAVVKEDGEEYPSWFDLKRFIMGEGKLPPEAEWELGKLLSIPFLLSNRTEELGDPELDAAQFPSAEVARFLSVRALRNAA